MSSCSNACAIWFLIFALLEAAVVRASPAPPPRPPQIPGGDGARIAELEAENAELRKKLEGLPVVPVIGCDCRRKVAAAEAAAEATAAAQVMVLEEGLAVSASEREALRRDLHETRNGGELGNVRQRLESAEARLHSETQRVAELEQERDDLRRRSDEELVAARRRQEADALERAQHKQRLLDSNDRLDNLIHEKAELQEKCNAAQTKASECEQKIVSVEEEHRKTELHGAELQHQVSKLQQSYDLASASVSAGEGRIANLFAEHAETSRQLENSVSVVAVCEARVVALEAAHDQLEAAREQLIAGRASADANTSSCREQVSALAEEIESLHNQATRSQDNLQACEGSIQAFREHEVEMQLGLKIALAETVARDGRVSELERVLLESEDCEARASGKQKEREELAARVRTCEEETHALEQESGQLLTRADVAEHAVESCERYQGAVRHRELALQQQLDWALANVTFGEECRAREADLRRGLEEASGAAAGVEVVMQERHLELQRCLDVAAADASASEQRIAALASEQAGMAAQLASTASDAEACVARVALLDRAHEKLAQELGSVEVDASACKQQRAAMEGDASKLERQASAADRSAQECQLSKASMRQHELELQRSLESALVSVNAGEERIAAFVSKQAEVSRHLENGASAAEVCEARMVAHEAAREQLERTRLQLVAGLASADSNASLCREQVSVLSEEVGSLGIEVATAKGAAQACEVSIKAFQLGEVERQRSLDVCLAEASASKDRVSALLDQRAEVGGQLLTVTSSIESCEARAAALKASLDELGAGLFASNESASACQDEMSHLAEQASNLLSRAASAEGSAQVCERALGASAASKSASDRRADALEVSLAEATAASAAEIERLSESLIGIAASANASSARSESIEQERAALKDKLAAADRNATSCVERFSALSVQKEEAERKVAAKDGNSIDAGLERVAALDIEKATAESRLSAAILNLSKCDGRVAALRSEKGVIQQMFTVLRRRLHASEHDIDPSKHEKADRRQIADLEDEQRRLQMSLGKALSSLNASEVKASDLTAKRMDCEQSLGKLRQGLKDNVTDGLREIRSASCASRLAELELEVADVRSRLASSESDAHTCGELVHDLMADKLAHSAQAEQLPAASDAHCATEDICDDTRCRESQAALAERATALEAERAELHAQLSQASAPSPVSYRVIAESGLVIRSGMELESEELMRYEPGRTFQVFERSLNRIGIVRLCTPDGWASERSARDGELLLAQRMTPEVPGQGHCSLDMQMSSGALADNFNFDAVFASLDSLFQDVVAFVMGPEAAGADGQTAHVLEEASQTQVPLSLKLGSSNEARAGAFILLLGIYMVMRLAFHAGQSALGQA